jgi:hypothetical protein
LFSRANKIEGAYEDLVIDLSDTSIVEQVSMGMTVMDVLQNYFEYRVSTLCGFPSITLEGQLEDRQKTRVNAEKLISQRCKAEFGKQFQRIWLGI